MPLMTCAPKRETSSFHTELGCKRRPRAGYQRILIQTEQHGQCRAQTHQHISAEPRRTALSFPLQTDAAAEQHSQSEPQHDRCKMKFAKICNRFCHVLLLLISCGSRVRTRLR